MKLIANALLLFSLLAYRRQADDVQPLVHAIELKRTADASAADCRLTEARTYYLDAAEALAGSPAESEPVAAGRGKLQAAIDVKLKELAKREAVISAKHKSAEELLGHGQVTAATELWTSYDGQACDPDFGVKVVKARKKADELMGRGDDEADVKRRLDLYTDAFHANSQTPGLYKKLSATRQQVSNLPCNGCRVAGKVVKRVLILGAIGAAGYFGWQQYQRYELNHAGPR